MDDTETILAAAAKLRRKLADIASLYPTPPGKERGSPEDLAERRELISLQLGHVLLFASSIGIEEVQPLVDLFDALEDEQHDRLLRSRKTKSKATSVRELKMRGLAAAASEKLYLSGKFKTIEAAVAAVAAELGVPKKDVIAWRKKAMAPAKKSRDIDALTYSSAVSKTLPNASMILKIIRRS